MLCLADSARRSIALARHVILHTMISGALGAPSTVRAALGRPLLAVT